MSKKDRTAIVFTLLYLIIAIGTGIENGHLLYGLAWVFLPTMIYWGHRFIKNDISFLSIDSNE